MTFAVECKDLLRQVASGDRRAFETLYDRLSPRVLGLAIKMLQDRAEAEEATIDTFVQVWRQANRFDPDKAEGVSWILMLARSRALDRLRARSREKAAPTEELVDIDVMSDDETPEQNRDRSERELRVREAIATLSTEQRDALEAVYFRGLTHNEVAETHQLPLGTVKTRVRSGLQALRRELKSLYGAAS